METIQKHFFSDMSVMLGRSMRHIFRSMDTIITVCLMPIAIMVLFVYVFGGAIDTGTDNYVNYLLPGILLIAIASGISYTAVRLFTDVQRGIIDRFRSMPIAPSTILWGHVLTSLVSNAISVVVIILVALIMGFRSSAGIQSWLAVVGILALFTLALTWVAVIPGLTATQVKASVNNARMPTTASHDWMPADERKPIINATRMMTTTEIALETSEVRTCPHSMVEGAIGMERNRSMIPRCTSVNKRT